MSEVPLIYQAITKVMEEVGCVGKNQKNQQQGFRFRGIDDVMNALHPALVRNQVFLVPEVLEQEREERKTKSGASMIYSICKMRYTFYAADGSSLSAVVIGEGMDTGDKATTKAMAIAFKYACFQVFCIPTEEMKDPDSETPEESVCSKKNDASGTSKPCTSAGTNRGKGSGTKENGTKQEENTKEKSKEKERDPFAELHTFLKKHGIRLETIYQLYKVTSLPELSNVKYNDILQHIEKIKQYQNTAA